MNKLREETKKFSREYIKNGQNGVQAVLDTNEKPISYDYAGVKAHENLKNPKIQDEILSYLPSLNLCAKDITKIKDLCVKKKDYSTALKCVEGHIRMQGGFKDSIDHTLKHSPEEIDEIDTMKLRLNLIEDRTFDTIEHT